MISTGVEWQTSHDVCSSVCLRILLISIAILSAYSIHLLLKCAGVVGELAQRAPRRTLSTARLTQHARSHVYDEFVAFPSGIRAYEQLGNRAFGPPGKVLAACIITVHNIGGKSHTFFHLLLFSNIR